MKVLGKVLLILFGLGVVIVLESGLRIFAPINADHSPRAWFRIDPFRAAGERVEVAPEYLGALRQESFVRHKPPGVTRVFCLGGSTTFGYPFPAEVAWPALLEKRLQALYPQRPFEVINLGGTAYGSARILGLLRSVLAYQADLIVIAGGDAEFVEDSFRASVSLKAEPNSWFNSLQLVQRIRRLLPKPDPPVLDVSLGDRGVAEVVFAPVLDGTVYRPDQRRIKEVEARLHENFEKISELVNAAGIPLVLCTLPCNEKDWPPDPDDRLPPAAQRRDWQKLWREAREAARNKQGAAALQLYDEAASRWHNNASFCFEYGRLLLQAGRNAEAGRWLRAAVDLDPTPIRAGTATNAAVRSVAERGGHQLVDLEQAFRNHSPQGVTGERLVLDYAHPTVEGQVLIARQIWAALATRLAGLADYDEERASALADEETRLAVTEPALDAQLAYVWGRIFERKGRLPQAVQMFRLALSQGYPGPYARLSLAEVLAALHQDDEALALARGLVQDVPGFAETYPVYAELLFRNLADDEARRRAGAELLAAYQRAAASGLRREPIDELMASVLFEQGCNQELMTVLETSLRDFPGNCQLLALQGRVIESEATAKVLAYYREALSRHPDCQMLYENLGLVQMHSEHWAAARETFEVALSRPEPLTNHYLNLGYVFWTGLGDRERARELFRTYLALNPQGLGYLPPEIQAAIDFHDR